MDLVFYDCLEAAVICGDFSKGLGAAIKLKAVQDQYTQDKPFREFPELRSVAQIDEDTIESAFVRIEEARVVHRLLHLGIVEVARIEPVVASLGNAVQRFDDL